MTHHLIKSILSYSAQVVQDMVLVSFPASWPQPFHLCFPQEP